MLLVFDTGNTNTVIGLYAEDQLLGHWRIASDTRKTADEYGMMMHQLFAHYGFSAQAISQVVISSVVPDLTGTLERMCVQYFATEPLVVGAGMKTGLVIRYENPKEVGADRIVNAVGGIEKYGAPLILVDFGTATTFCAINGAGEYLGGAISPGIGIAMEALFARAAKLPKVDLIAPPKVIGKNTVHAMQSGLVYGYAGMIDTMVTRVAEEMGTQADRITVVATGGRSEMICEHTTTVNHIDPLLTLEGLRVLARRNFKEA